MNKSLNITGALSEVEEYCSDETYTTLLAFIESLENDIELLNIELDSMEHQHRRRRVSEEDWR
jgi:hypothetical protein